jgi:lactoylglutathione lyase
MKLLSIRLLVSDFDTCFRFYRDVMGFTATWGAEGEGYADFDAGGGQVGLSLFDRQTMASTVGTLSLPANADAQDSMALIFQVEDVDGTIEQLRERGPILSWSLQATRSGASALLTCATPMATS